MSPLPAKPRWASTAPATSRRLTQGSHSTASSWRMACGTLQTCWGPLLACCCTRGLSADQVPTGSAPSGCPSSGRLARLARKCRSRQLSTPLSVAMCSSVHTSPLPGQQSKHWYETVCTGRTKPCGCRDPRQPWISVRAVNGATDLCVNVTDQRSRSTVGLEAKASVSSRTVGVAAEDGSHGASIVEQPLHDNRHVVLWPHIYQRLRFPPVRRRVLPMQNIRSGSGILWTQTSPLKRGFINSPASTGSKLVPCKRSKHARATTQVDHNIGVRTGSRARPAFISGARARAGSSARTTINTHWVGSAIRGWSG